MASRSRLMMTAGLPLLTFLYGLAGFYGCTAAKQEESEVSVKLSPEEEKALASLRAETEIGRDMAGRLLAHFGTLGDDELIGYVNQIGNFVASYGDHPDRRYMFAILDRDDVNAFACPGGYILITAGALRAAQTESQLAHVLGHEVAHVGYRHMFDTLKAMGEKEAAETAEVGRKSLDEVLSARKRPKPDETGAGAVLARYLSGTGGAGINILQAAKAGMGVILEKGLDQKLEFQADEFGVRYAIRAGYSPEGLKRFLDQLQQKQDPKAIKNLGKTHPPLAKRLVNIDEVLRELQAMQITGAVGWQRWLEMQKRVPPPQAR